MSEFLEEGYEIPKAPSNYTKIEKDTSGYTHVWEYAGECIDPSDSQTFTQGAGDQISLYGTGETAGCSPSISLNTASWSVNSGNSVSTSSTYTTGLTYFTVTNDDSGGAITITIHGADMTGGGYTWTLSDTATPGNMVHGMKAGLSGESYNITVKKNTPYNTLVSGLANNATQDFGLKLYTPTVYSDGNDKSGPITLTVACD